ncbi:MAG: hypothetical protein F6J93_13130 [Oscillatoria sp. SIO1A7]|nr:hypothetical protein [Oscillatoria sp. SIO1A7]
MPNAQCPMPNAQCPMPNARRTRIPVFSFERDLSYNSLDGLSFVDPNLRPNDSEGSRGKNTH